MAKYLVIGESPAKVKTIKKFLGKNYEVLASNGHVRDLPKSTMGIDVEGDFEPKYITIRGKGEILAKLRKEAKKAEKIYLATDPDREGEAISWHLSKALNLDGKNVRRISFNEITQSAVKTSLKNPREIDMDLVDAQQARRALDRMVGYRISPLLWAKVKRGLSAGRVQSVALRIVCDREEEINAFIPEEYWSLEASLLPEGDKKPLVAKLVEKGKNKVAISSKEEMNQVLKELEGEAFQVVSVKKGERHQKAPLPFTTSTLQQEASKALNFPISVHAGMHADTKECLDALCNIPKPTYVLVALGEDEKNIEMAVRIRSWLAKYDIWPVIDAIVYNTDKKRALQGIRNYSGQEYDIHFIGDLESSYSEKVILESDVEAEALQRHMKWGEEEQFWKYEYNYRSSMASAIHKKMKILCKIPGADKPVEERTPEEREGLRVLEHNRWNAYMRSEGYTYDEVRNNLAKTHHCLVEFEKLSLKEQMKDDD